MVLVLISICQNWFQKNPVYIAKLGFSMNQSCFFPQM